MAPGDYKYNREDESYSGVTVIGASNDTSADTITRFYNDSAICLIDWGHGNHSDYTVSNLCDITYSDIKPWRDPQLDRNGKPPGGLLAARFCGRLKAIFLPQPPDVPTLWSYFCTAPSMGRGIRNFKKHG